MDTFSSSQDQALQALTDGRLDPVAEAELLRALHEKEPVRWSLPALAQRVRRSLNEIKTTLQLLKLPLLVREDLRQGHLTREQGVELLKLPTGRLRNKVAREVVHNGFSLLQTRQIVNGMRQLTGFRRVTVRRRSSARSS